MLGQPAGAALEAPLGQVAPTWREPHRPQFHFSPPAMWMNDPNGMVFFEGEYHLFYQYYPDDTVCGPMHWGHAVSTDLVHWQHLPIALYPDELGYIFSGSAVVDWNNSGGFGVGGRPPLVAIYTYHHPELAEAGGKNHEYQGIAWSNDHGRSWTKYAGNPVLPNPGGLQDFRDPKVSWHEDSQQWIMALSATDHMQFWASPDLKDWRFLSEFGREWGAHGGVWECPDLVEMPVQGSEETRWVLILSLNPGGRRRSCGSCAVTLAVDIPVSQSEWLLEFEFSHAVAYGFGIAFSPAPVSRRRLGRGLRRWRRQRPHRHVFPHAHVPQGRPVRRGRGPAPAGRNRVRPGRYLVRHRGLTRALAVF